MKGLAWWSSLEPIMMGSWCHMVLDKLLAEKVSYVMVDLDSMKIKIERDLN